MAKGGILGIAATDTAVLCGAKPSICFKRYGAYSMKRVAAKEVGIRILLGRIQTLAAKYDRGIEPMLSYSEGHHLRVFIKLVKKNDVKLKWIDLSMTVLESEEENAGGPLWVDKIINEDLIPTDCEGKLGKFFQTLKNEANGPPGLYDINDIAREAELGQTPRRDKIIKCLGELGYFASSSVFSPLGIKTNAPKSKRCEAIGHAQSL